MVLGIELEFDAHLTFALSISWFFYVKILEKHIVWVTRSAQGFLTALNSGVTLGSAGDQYVVLGS